jgi:hypothetical protein
MPYSVGNLAAVFAEDGVNADVNIKWRAVSCAMESTAHLLASAPTFIREKPRLLMYRELARKMRLLLHFVVQALSGKKMLSGPI